jgi:hypothetical protein
LTVGGTTNAGVCGLRTATKGLLPGAFNTLTKTGALLAFVTLTVPLICCTVGRLPTLTVPLTGCVAGKLVTLTGTVVAPRLPTFTVPVTGTALAGMLTTLTFSPASGPAATVINALPASVDVAMRGEAVSRGCSRITVLDDGLGFSLVPWRQVLEQRIGQQLTATLRGDQVTWSFGRQRGLSR